MATGIDIWDLSGCTAQQQTILRQGFDRCTFDFNLLKPGMAAGNQFSPAGKTTIPVTFKDLSNFQIKKTASLEDEHSHEDGVHVVTAPGNAKATLGLFWFDGHIELDISLVNQPQLCQEVFFAEGAHATDMYYMNVKGWRPIVFGYYHPQGSDTHEWFGGPYYSQVGEAFMGGFIRAFTDIPLDIQGFVHPTTDAIAAQIRALLMPVVPPPQPTPVPTNVQIVRQPADGKVGSPVTCQFVVQDQFAKVMVGITATVTPVSGSQRWLASDVRPAENGVFTWQVTPGKEHPAAEGFHLEITCGSAKATSNNFVVGPSITPPTPPPPTPPVAETYTIHVFADGHVTVTKLGS